MKNSILEKKTILLLLILAFVSKQVVWGQNIDMKSDSLLTELRKALKLDNNDKMISVSHFLPDCWKNDSLSNHLLVREQQADGEEVTRILIAITYTKNEKLFDKTKALFEEFIDFYIKESVPLLKDNDNIYTCRRNEIYLDFIGNQCQILGSFNQALISLTIAQNNFSPEEIYKYDMKRMTDYRKYTRRVQKLDEEYFMSSKYGVIISQRLFYNYVGKRVDYLAPYHKEIEAVYLEHLASFDLTDQIKGTKAFKEYRFFIERVVRRLSLISQTTGNPEIGKAIVNLFDENAEIIYAVPLYKAFNNIKGSDESAMIFLDYIFEHPVILKLVPHGRIELFGAMWNESRKHLIKPALLERLNDSNGRNRMMALYFIQSFPDEDVIEACLKIYKSKKKGIGERDRAKSNLTGFLQAPNLTEAQKNRIRRQLKN